MIKVSENLKILAEKIFKNCNKKLYIVGGAVRDGLEGRETEDIDITGAFSERVIKECACDFKITAESPKFRTISVSKGKEKYEFTSFRSDSYDMSGKHRPYDTAFTEDIETDALRRDFTVNAIYYDILENKIENPVGGAEDLKNKILKTPKNAMQTFSEDGLRLLRFIRFKEGLNYKASEEVILSAKKCAFKIKEIAKERIGQELKYLINLDKMYAKIPFAHYSAIRFADEIGVLSYIMPELTDCKGIGQNKNFHCFDVYEHSLYAFKYSDIDVRLPALLHDIGKPDRIKKYFKCTGHAQLGAQLADGILKRTGFSSNERKEVYELISCHEFDIKCSEKVENVRMFICRHSGIIEKLIKLMECDAAAKKEPYNNALGAKRIKEQYEIMREQKIPITVRELPINGEDLLNLGYKGTEIKKALNSVLYKGVFMLKRYTKKECLKLLENKDELLIFDFGL